MIRRLHKAKIVTLFVTYGCNLNCVYCFEQFKDAKKKMPLELAKTIICKEIDEIKKNGVNDAIKIDLFGGEPLMNFPFIKDFCEWFWQQNFNIGHIIYATTNGTLLDDEKKEWFRKHKDNFVLVMSVDGDSAMQMENRGYALDKLPIEFAHELWPDQPFKMTISSSTLPNLADGVISLRKKGYLVESRLAQGEQWQKDDDLIYKRELSKIADFYIKLLGVTRNGGYFEYKPMFIEQLPIPQLKIENKELAQIERLIDNNNYTEIEYIVYNLYGLTQDEINYINSL